MIRPAEPADRRALEAFMERHNSLRAARLGRLEAPLEHPALLAVAGLVAVGAAARGCG